MVEHSPVVQLRLSQKEQEQVAELLEGRRSKLCMTTMLMRLVVRVQIVVPGLQLEHKFLHCMVILVPPQTVQLEKEPV
jgi:hypothetical protein